MPNSISLAEEPENLGTHENQVDEKQPIDAKNHISSRTLDMEEIRRKNTTSKTLRAFTYSWSLSYGSSWGERIHVQLMV
ncbi:hypothetical protein Tco_0971386 [Tanacetum coccineum]